MFDKQSIIKIWGQLIKKSVLYACLSILITSHVLPLTTYAAPLPEDDLHSLDYDSVHHKTYCPGSGAGSAQGTGDCLEAPLPTITDGNALATAIDQYIEERKPSSPLKGLGAEFVKSGIQYGINPMYVVAVAFKESALGTTGDTTLSINNSFGRTATSEQPHKESKNGKYLYYAWPSWKDSVSTDYEDNQFAYMKRKFFDQGQTTIDTIRPLYCPDSDDCAKDYVAVVKGEIQKMIDRAGNALGCTSGDGGAPQPTPTSPAPTPTPAEGETQPAMPSGGGAVVVLDPGHGGVVAPYTDPVTGLGDRETANEGEREDMQDVANQVKSGLEQSGYVVTLTKASATEAVSKRQRVDAAKAANATIAVSIHSDGGRDFGGWGEVWPQFVGGYRQNQDGSNKVTFSNQDVANKSDAYSTAIAAARDKEESGGSGVVKKVVGQSSSFGKSRGLPSYGDLSLVQLWSDTVPWVYNEIGGRGGLSPEQKQKYATGIINGIKSAVPSNGTGTGDCSSGSGQGGGDVVATALNYAWPDYRGPGYTERKPEYATAIDKAKSEGQYIGGCNGVDCGAFTTRVFIDSGWDPNYNHAGKGGATPTQLDWAKANWQSVGMGSSISTADLQPGDVAIKNGHTFMWVGEQQGFETTIASASLCGRAPMAGKENPLDGAFEWFRKK